MLDIKPFEMIYPEFEKYKPFVVSVFRYLNGYINYANPCKLFIDMYSDKNYAEFAKPDIVIIYLGSIINNFYGKDNEIKKIIIITMAHELSHSWQNSDMIRYSNDPYYKQDMENQNEGYTELWITQRAEEIYNLFGVKIEYSNYAKEKVQPYAADYLYSNPKDFYIHVILDVIYRNDKYRDPLIRLFNEADSIVFHINDSEQVLLKYNGEFNDRGIPTFNRIVDNYCRYGKAIRYFVIDLNVTEVNIYERKGIDFHMIVKDWYYYPIAI